MPPTTPPAIAPVGVLCAVSLSVTLWALGGALVLLGEDGVAKIVPVVVIPVNPGVSDVLPVMGTLRDEACDEETAAEDEGVGVLDEAKKPLELATTEIGWFYRTSTTVWVLPSARRKVRGFCSGIQVSKGVVYRNIMDSSVNQRRQENE
ncbi:hypothetical protein C0992_003720 [Termitomyces sp. T32_za158]|nr:hypothetical protein C0992_003720 [Termitomyces sp. T32_za158]